MKKRKTKGKVYLYIGIALVIATSVFIVQRYFKVASEMFSCSSFAETKGFVVKAVPLNGNLLVGTSDGEVVCYDTNGKSLFNSSVEAKIFDVNLNADKTRFVIASSSFFVYDKNGKLLFEKKLDNYMPLKAKYLQDGKYKLLFQSLTDFSYKALTIDQTGKVVLTEDVPDLGEPSFVEISGSGRILFAGERGEIYIIENNARILNTYIEKAATSIGNVFCYFAGPNTIIAGYRNLADPTLTVPVYFFDASLRRIKEISFNSSINSIYIGNGKVVFGLDSGFEFYDTSGEKTKVLFEEGYCAFFYSENNYYNVYVFCKKPARENEKPIYKIILKDFKDEVLGSYIDSYDYPPSLVLSDIDKRVFIIQGNVIRYLHR